MRVNQVTRNMRDSRVRGGRGDGVERRGFGANGGGPWENWEEYSGENEGRRWWRVER